MDFMKVYMSFLLFVIFLVGCGSNNTYRQSTIVSKPYNAPEIDSNVKQKYLNAINAVRSQERSCGSAGKFRSAPALKWSNALYKAAYEHSTDIAKSNNFSHKGSNGSSDWTSHVQHLGRCSSFKERIENNGYKQWKNIAENIAMGSSTVDQVMTQWLDSDGHCANIMNPNFTDVGMADVTQEGSDIWHCWTQNFAAHQ